MTHPFCSQEKEIRRLIDAGAWPQGSMPELQAHAKSCRSCAELIRVRQAFRDARSEAVRQARLQSPGLLWWRAQLRRRNEAVARIGRPLLGAQVFALVATLAIVAGLSIFQAKEGFQWLAGLAESSSLHWLHWKSLESLSSVVPVIPGTSISLLVPAVLMLGLLSGVIVYLVLDDLDNLDDADRQRHDSR